MIDYGVILWFNDIKSDWFGFDNLNWLIVINDDFDMTWFNDDLMVIWFDSNLVWLVLI